MPSKESFKSNIMETHNKITIRKALSLDLSLAEQLKSKSMTFDTAIKELALKTKLNEAFLIQNIDRIRNWID